MNAASERTKKVLANTLLSLMKEQDFSEITITEVVEKSDLNRKTFYYHFRSTSDLLRWALNREAIELIKKYDIRLGFDEAINFVMDYAEENRDFLSMASQAIGKDSVRDFFYSNLYPAIFNLIQSSQQGKQTLENQQFLAEFYTEAAAGILQKWLEKATFRSRKETAECLKMVIGANF